MFEKLKSWMLDDVVFYSLLIVGVGVVAFGLGRHSVQNTQQVATATGIQIMQNPESETTEKTGITVIASRSGTKYHLPSCPGALQIKSENKVEFTSIEAAEAAGYTPSANCEGI